MMGVGRGGARHITGNRRMKVSEQGLTLIELMVVIAILGIIVAVAWPTYDRQMSSQRRAEGIRALSLASNDLERCFVDTADYQSCTISAAITGGLKNYTLTLDAPNAGSYTLTATPKDNQIGDECGNLTLNQLGQKGRTGSAPLKRCWAE